MKYTKQLQLQLLSEANVTTPEDVELVGKMKESSLITVKRLKNGVISLNFSDKTFREGSWNEQTVKARGLFFSEKLQKVVARGYDKFFNLGEVVGEERLSVESIVSNKIKFPVDVWHKYNGYLGVLGTNEVVLSDVLYSGVFFGRSNFNFLKRLYSNFKMNVDKPHVTLAYYGGSKTEAVHKFNDEYVNSPNPNEYRVYKFSKLHVSKDGDLVALEVEEAKYLPGYKPKYPHVTLYASGRYKPVDAAKLISGEVPCDTYTFPTLTLTGRVGHYGKEKKLLAALPRTRLFVASKTTNRGRFATNFKKILKTKLSKKPGGLTYLKNYLVDNDVSAIFEVIDTLNDPHVIQYNESDVVLLDLIYNTTNFKSVTNAEVVMKNLATHLGIKSKEKVRQLNFQEELVKFVQEVTGVNYELLVTDKSGTERYEPVEGFVFQGSNNYMFKIKTNYYNFWKKIRGAYEALQKDRKNENWKVPDVDSEQYKKYLTRFQDNKEVLNYALSSSASESNVIQFRNSFLSSNPNFKINKIVFDSEEATGRGRSRTYEVESDETKDAPATFLDSDTQYPLVKSAWEKVSKLTKNGDLMLTVGKGKRTNFSFVLQRQESGKNSVAEAISNVSNLVDSGKKVALVLIGPTGSGKSTFVSKLKSKYGNEVSVHSTDDKFMKSGRYEFDENKLGKYHSETQKEADDAMARGVQVVVLDNTNLKQADFSSENNKEKKFTNYANERGYTLHFVAFLTDPSTVYGEEGVSAPSRLQAGKVFKGAQGKNKVYSMLQNYYNTGLQSLYGYTSKFEGK